MLHVSAALENNHPQLALQAIRPSEVSLAAGFFPKCADIAGYGVAISQYPKTAS